MRAILFQSLKTAFAGLALYAVLTAITLLIFPPPGKASTFDTALASRTVFETQAKYFVMNREPLQTAGTHVVFLGASNTVVGFPVPLVQSNLRDAIVSSAAINGANLTELRQTLELTRTAIKPADRPRTMYVVGLWYGMFEDNAVRWPHSAGQHMETAIDSELYRYGFYRRTAEGPVPVIPENTISLARIAFYPVMALEKMVRDVTQPVRARYLGAQTLRSDADRNAYVTSAKDQKDEMEYWAESFPEHRLSAPQFAELETLIDRALADRSTVVLVNLPIPAWHAAAVHYDAEYAAAMQVVLARYRDNPLFSTIDMSDLDSNDLFSDEIHPKPRTAPLWVRRISGPLDERIRRIEPGPTS